MAKILDREATIKTAIVEVKALTVSGKQVTLALFRQLEEKALIDPETCDLKGIPWGWVNYHFDRCHDEGEHMHVVWQEGDSLRRCQVNRKAGARLEDRWSQKADRSENSAFLCEAVHQRPCVPRDRSTRQTEWYELAVSDYGCYRAVLPSGLSASIPGSLLRPLLQWWSLKTDTPSHERAIKEVYESFLTASKKAPLCWPDWQTADEARWSAQAQAQRVKGASLRSKWEELYESLKDLNHLFIAL